MIQILTALAMLVLSARAISLSAQPTNPGAFIALRADGNGIAALSEIISIGFSGTSGEALATIAVTARLNLTYDPSLALLGRRMNIPASRRSVARALIEVGQASQLRIRVSPQGQVVVDAAPAGGETGDDHTQSGTSDTTMRSVALPMRRVQAERIELAAFNSTVSTSSHIASAAALRAVPSFVEPDVLRAVQLLPGIEARSDWTAAFSIRGGESDQTLVLLDGFPIFSPFHVGGVFSTFIDGTVSGIELHTGAMPAKFGGRLSGVLDVQSVSPTDSAISATVNVSLISSSAVVRKGFASREGGWFVGVRRTYIDAVTKPFRGGIPYHFEDINGRLTRNIGAGFKLGLTTYAGREKLSAESQDQEKTGWNNLMVGVSLRRQFNTPSFAGLSVDSSVFEQRLSVASFEAYVHLFGFEQDLTNRASDSRVSASFTLFKPNSSTAVGYELALQQFQFHVGSGFAEYANFVPNESLSQETTAAAVYANHSWRPHSTLLLETGARLEGNRVERGIEFSPRASLKYFLTPNFAFKAGGGRYTQWMHSLGRDEEPLQPAQFWTLSDLARGVSVSKDVVVGLEKWMSPSRLVSITGFHKQYNRVLVPNQFSDPNTARDAYVAADGVSSGAELLLRQLDGGRFSGWMSYSLARSLRTSETGERYVPSQDRRHNLNAVGSWQLRNYTVGARINLASGYPYTPQIGGFTRTLYDPVSQKWIPERRGVLSLQGPQNSLRTPTYQRIDLSVSRRGRLFGRNASTYLSVVNVLNNRNDAGYIYSFHRDNSTSLKTSFPNMPILPSFGVKIGN